MSNSTIIPLAKAGYRERVFLKSQLAKIGASPSRYKGMLADGWGYDPHADCIVNAQGDVKFPVTREGSESVMLLEKFGQDDKDC